MPVRWFESRADPSATTQLFLLHYAGGGAAMYSGWFSMLPEDIAVHCVQLPGRQQRWSEPAFTALGPLVDALADAFDGELDGRPFGLFGHSMGALLGYRLAVTLDKAPALVGVSGWAPAGFTMPVSTPDGLPDTQLIEAVQGMGALPSDLDPDLVALWLPAMRADLAVCASFADDAASVPSPLAAYSGTHDPMMEPGAMDAWAARTPRYLGNRTFPGDHFFVHQHADAIVADLTVLLRRHAQYS